MLKNSKNVCIGCPRPRASQRHARPTSPQHPPNGSTWFSGSVPTTSSGDFFSTSSKAFLAPHQVSVGEVSWMNPGFWKQKSAIHSTSATVRYREVHRNYEWKCKQRCWSRYVPFAVWWEQSSNIPFYLWSILPNCLPSCILPSHKIDNMQSGWVKPHTPNQSKRHLKGVHPVIFKEYSIALTQTRGVPTNVHNDSGWF